MKRAQEIIMESLKKQNLTRAELARSLDENPANLYQQIGELKDMKVSRFAEVMEHIGYEVSVIELGYRKVSPKYGKSIMSSGAPRGLFWYEESGQFVLIDSERDEPLTMTFSNRDELMKRLRRAVADGRKCS